MPAEMNRMDGNERFRHLVHNGNPKVLGALLTELGTKEARKLIEECYSEESESALIHCVKKAGEGNHKKDEDLLECCLVLIKYGADVNERDGSKKTALHYACGFKNDQMVKLLLDSGADPSLMDGLGFNALHLAVTAGSVECVQLLLGHSKSQEIINKHDYNGSTPILTAVQRKEGDVLKALVTSGGDVNIQEITSKRTPLHYALYLKTKELFEYLIKHGADLTKTDHRGTNIVHRSCAISEPAFLKLILSQNTPDAKKALRMEDSEGATPVIVACQNGNIEQLRMLVEAGAPVANKDKFRRCALHHCVENTDTECAEYLLRSIPSLLTCADEEGLTPLHMAVIAGNIPLIKILLKRGANLKTVDNEKHTVAHWATVCGHADVLDVLLENAAELSAPDKHHAYPIHYAAQMMSKKGSGSDSGSGGEGSLQILKTLLKNKVSPEAEDKDKRTPIIWAASAGSPEACRVLVEHGADVNRADKDDLTALHCAASRGHAACVEALVKYCKAEVDPVDKNQCTPLFYATTLGHINCMKTLLELGADSKHTDTRGRTAAHCATVSGSTEALDLLRHYKVDLWARNLKGDQPLHEAAQSGHLDVVQYLLSHPDGRPYVIDSGNNDGRTCLHIAALTNNVWLCKFLLERNANVNAVMRNKGKFYSPYDAALIKGHTEAKDILFAQSGRPGSAVVGYAAQTIQVKYRYHKKRKQRPDSGDTDRHKSPGGKSKKSSSKAKENSQEETSPKETSPKETSPKETSLKEIPVKATSPTETASKPQEEQNSKEPEDIKSHEAGEESENSETKDEEGKEKNIISVSVKVTQDEESKPKYVDKATQITTTAVPLKRQTQPAKPTVNGDQDSSKESKGSQKAEIKSVRTDTDSKDKVVDSKAGNESLKKQSSSESQKSTKSTQKQKSDGSKTHKSPSSSEQSKTSSSSKTIANSTTASKVQRKDGKNSEKTKQENHLKTKIGENSHSSQSEDEDSPSERASSHGNTSDIESSSSELRRVQVRKSPKTRGARYLSQKQPSNIANKKVQRQKTAGDLRKESSSDNKHFDSAPQDKGQSDNQTSLLSKETTENKSEGGKTSPLETEVASANKISAFSTATTTVPKLGSSKQEAEEAKSESDHKHSASKDSDKSTKSSAMGSGNTKKLPPIQNGHDAQVAEEEDSKTVKKLPKVESTQSNKKSVKKNVKYSSSSDGLHLDSDREQKSHKSDDGEESKSRKKKKNQYREDDGYTDVEDMDGLKGQNDENTPTPRRKKTRPNKLIHALQESVKRYEFERKSIRQLHQIRRAQIYSGPVYDLALFRKIVDNVHNKQNGESINADTWEEYLQGQMKLIQEERKSAGIRRSAHHDQNNTNNESQNSARGGSASFPQPHPSHRRENTTLDGRSLRQSKSTPRQDDHAAFSSNSSQNDSARSGNMSARTRRAQTAHGTRTSPTRKDEFHLSEDCYHDDPLWSTSRDAIRRRQELTQRKLIQAYRPYGGVEIFQSGSGSSTSRPVTRGGRPLSTMSSKTNTSNASSASTRRSRAASYTIMTSYGSRRIRNGTEAESNPSNTATRKRYPLIFQDPDVYERSRTKDGKGHNSKSRSPSSARGQGQASQREEMTQEKKYDEKTATERR